MRPQTTLRLSREELARLDAAAARLHLERAALIRAAALGAADIVLEAARPLVLAVEPAALLRRVAARLEGEPPERRAAAPRTRKR